jgi:hypothetical protein
VNRAWGLALDFVGASSYLWRFKHNVQHHTYANVDGMDADIAAGPFLRLAGLAAAAWLASPAAHDCSGAQAREVQQASAARDRAAVAAPRSSSMSALTGTTLSTR